ncbi:hypothetical protein MMC11_003485 [Xylographa trunciseda]|nr:hypothetical protein [Xylographa trunciseda]
MSDPAESTTMDKDYSIRAEEHLCTEHLYPVSSSVRDDPQAASDEDAKDPDPTPEQGNAIHQIFVVEPPIEPSSQSCWARWRKHGLSMVLLLLLLAVIAILAAEFISGESKTARTRYRRGEILWK